MKVGDKVRIIDADAFEWTSREDLTKIEGVVTLVYTGNGLFKVRLEKDGRDFRPTGCENKTEWNFWPSEIEVINA